MRYKSIIGFLLLALFCSVSSAQAIPGELLPAEEPPVLLERVSQAPDGRQTDGPSHAPAVSGDGRLVVFLSDASNLVEGDTNELMDVFVYARDSGAVELVSIGHDGVTPANGEPSRPSISSDGRYVVFNSAASNLVISDTNGTQDVFIYDRNTKVTERISVTSDEVEITQDAFTRRPAVSADGRFVVFYSNAPALAPEGAAAPSINNVYLRDRWEGETLLVTQGYNFDIDGLPANGNSEYPTLSDDGNWVAYYSAASNLVISDTNGTIDVFLYSRLDQETWRVSVASDGSQGNGDSDLPAISADGRFVAFVSSARNLVAGDTNGHPDIFVHDRLTGVTELVSRPTFGGLANGLSDVPSLSADGRYVAFYSYADNLSLWDDNTFPDVFRHDRQQGITELVSLGEWLQSGDNSSLCSTISHDGQVVAFYSFAENLVEDDGNGFEDVYLRDFTRPLPVYISRLPLIYK